MSKQSQDPGPTARWRRRAKFLLWPILGTDLNCLGHILENIEDATDNYQSAESAGEAGERWPASVHEHVDNHHPGLRPRLLDTQFSSSEEDDEGG